MYLNTLSLKNFKSLKNFGPIDFTPITLLCGTNSSGKSSFIQSLLLLKQTYETKKSLLFPLNLPGHLKDFGKEFKNLVYYKSCEDVDIKFEIKNIITVNKKIKEKVGTFSFKIGNIVDGRIDELSPDYCIKELIYSDENGVRIEIKSISNQSEYTLTTNKINKVLMSSDIKDLKNFKIFLNFSGMIPVLDRQKTNISKIKKNELFILFLMGEFFQSYLFPFFSQVKYIGPIRNAPERNKEIDIGSDDIGVDGNNVNNVLYLELNKKKELVSKFCTIDESGNFKVDDNVPFHEILELWTNKLGIHNIEAKHDKVMVSLNVDSSKFSNLPVNIADVGFGTSQILPIIVEAIRMGKDDTLILEQPEIHLHPNLEMVLADFFICMAVTGRRFIIETHSKHLIDRLVKRIVQDKSNEVNKLVSIYFFKKEKAKGEGSTFEKIKIDPIKGIRSWPKDFFDKGGIELRETIQASIDKLKKKEVKD